MLIRGARLVDGAIVDIDVEDGEIVAVLPHDPDDEETSALDARGLLALPGLVNGHTHSHEILQRGRYAKLPLEVWMHYLRPPLPFTLSREDVYARTLLAAIEALHGGATTVVDDVNLVPHAGPEHAEAVFRAYEDVGIRAFVGVSMFDRHYFAAVPWVKEEMEPELFAELAARPTPDSGQFLALARELFHTRPAGRVRALAAPSAPQRCTNEFLVDLLGLAADAGVPAIVHVHETRLQAVTAQLLYGKTMVAHLDDLGVLSSALSLVHGVWLTPDDLERLGRSGATVQHNPVSNLRLGSGVAPVRALLDAGVAVSIGSDGCGSCVAARMLDNVRLAALLGSLLPDEPERWLSAREAWTLASEGGARALGLGDVGRIAPGYRADLLLVRLDGPAFAPLNDPLRQLVYGDHSALDTVLVDGEVVLRGGRVVSVDEHAALAAARELHERLLPAFAESDRMVDRMRPAYERIHARSLAHPIPPDTFPARL
jgi:5-methylthioadenosine/S-adenosylhomocysteine deaminase